MLKSKILLALGCSIAILPLHNVYAATATASSTSNTDSQLTAEEIAAEKLQKKSTEQVDTLQQATQHYKNSKVNLEGKSKAPDMSNKKIGKIIAEHDYNLALPFKSGDTLNIANIDQLVDNLKTGLTEPIVLLKPTDNPNVYDVIVKTKRLRQFKANFSLDNDNDSNFGSENAYLTLSRDHLLSYGDLLTVVLRENLSDNRYQHTDGLRYANYSIPMGKYKLSLTRYRNTQKNRMQLSDLLLTAYTDRADVTLTNTYNRSQKRKLSYYVGTRHAASVNKLIDRTIGVSTNSYTNFATGWNGLYYGTNSAFQITPSLEFYTGRWTNNLAAGYKSSYTKANLNIFYTKNFNQQKASYDNYTFNFVGSYSPYHQLNNRQMSIGGINSVRGFKDSTVRADKGMYLRNTWTRHYKHWAPFIGLDMSISRDYNIGWSDRLVGGALGFNYTNRNLDATITLGQELRRSKGMPREAAPIYLDISYDF